MSSVSAAATNAARQLWDARVGRSRSAAHNVPATVQLLEGLRLGLSRWVGVAGYSTLLDRAVGIAREDYAWLTPLFERDLEPKGLLVAIDSFGMREIMAGCEQLVGVLIELLSRIVGIDMAVHLVKHVGLSNPKTEISRATEGEVDE